MRNLAGGFVFGYLFVALLVTPALLWALQMTPSYTGGVLMVLDRSGILVPIKSEIQHYARARERLLDQFAATVADRMFPRIPD